MKTVDEMIADILEAEGGYVDDGADKGGATKHGVSLRYAIGVGLDLDGDGDTDKDDILEVTPEIAAKLYKEDFLVRPKIDRLPAPVIPQVFDCAVNHGPPRAIMFVQDVINAAGFGPTTVDGVLGPKTRAQAAQAQEEMGALFNNAIMYERLNFYDRIVENCPTQKRFINGWRDRARSFEMGV